MSLGGRPTIPTPVPSLLLACLGLAVASQAAAQTAAPAPSVPAAAAPSAVAPASAPAIAPAPVQTFAIKGFSVTGENPLGDGDTARVLAPFLRADATIDTLQKATTALEAALRDRGFGLHRVVLPPQAVGDTVSLNIVKFTVNKVSIEGRNIYDEANIRASLPELKEGATPNFKTLAVQTAIVNENPNKQVQVGLRESDEPDKIDATISVVEQRPWTFAVGLSNAGSKSSGRDRLTVSGGHTNLFNLDHQFNGAYTTSIERFSDVRQLGLSYRIPLYAQGGVIGMTYTRSDVVGDFGLFSSTGAGHTAGISYTAYLPPDGGRRSYVTLSFDDKVFKAARINDIIVPGQLNRRSRPVTLGYTARTESDTAVWGYSAELSLNTGTGQGNSVTAYRTEDPRVSTTRFKIVRGSANYTGTLSGAWLWSVRGQMQYSPDVLISGEQFGLGGVSSVRGTSVERPISGDRGVSGSFELTTPELATGLRFLGFVDAGVLGNNSPDGGSKPSSDSLASLGLGLRYTNGNVSLTADYGRLVRGSKVPLTLNTSAPRKGDDKLYLNLAVRF